jgi:Tol biopolymer transport system component
MEMLSGRRLAGRRSTRRQFLGETVGAAVAATVAGIIAPRRAILALAAGAPSGTIVLPRGGSLALVRADGSDDRTLLTLPPGQFVADVALSPDGTRVAFGIFTAGTTAPGGSDIAVAPTDPTAGSFTIIVPRDRPGMQLAAPCWSSDGTALAFEGVGLGADGTPVMFTDWVAADGSGRQRLVEDGHLPTLSPDGREVAYVRSKPDGDSLWTRPFHGGPEREILSETQFISITGPHYSPDGSAIAFGGTMERPVLSPKLLGPDAPSDPSRLRSVARHGFPSDAYIMSANGADVRAAALLAYDDLALCWSPDGAWLAVSGAAGLKLVNLSDGTIRPVTSKGSFGAIDWR